MNNPGGDKVTVEIGTKRAFEAAHRQLGDPSKCGKLHGHNWLVEVMIEGNPNGIGYVKDFKDIYAIVDEFDHAVLLKENDPLIDILNTAKQNVVILDLNPTCENLSIILANMVWELQDIEEEPWKGLMVRVWENGTSSASHIIKGDEE